MQKSGNMIKIIIMNIVIMIKIKNLRFFNIIINAEKKYYLN
jgi:hypothetical protein